MHTQTKHIDLVPLSGKSRLTNYSVIPHDLLEMGLSMPAVVLYAKLLNRANLSMANGKTDDKGRVYIYYRQEDLVKELHVSKTSIKTYMRELVNAGLIEKRRADTGRANMIFVMVPGSSIMGQPADPYGAESRPFNGQMTDCIWGGPPTPNNYKNNTFLTTKNNRKGKS